MANPNIACIKISGAQHTIELRSYSDKFVSVEGVEEDAAYMTRATWLKVKAAIDQLFVEMGA